jgi:Xaa-Pro aminopeptidase
MQVRDWIKNVPPSGITPSTDPPSASHQHVGTLVTNLACICEFVFRPSFIFTYKTTFLAYVLNLRGDDIPFNPIFISYLYIGLDRAILFIEQEKVEQSVRSYLENLDVETRGYNDIWLFLRTREWGDGKVIHLPFLR